MKNSKCCFFLASIFRIVRNQRRKHTPWTNVFTSKDNLKALENIGNNSSASNGTILAAHTSPFSNNVLRSPIILEIAWNWLPIKCLLRNDTSRSQCRDINDVCKHNWTEKQGMQTTRESWKAAASSASWVRFENILRGNWLSHTLRL